MSIKELLHNLDKDIGEELDNDLRSPSYPPSPDKISRATNNVLDLEALEQRYIDENKSLNNTKKTLVERKGKIDTILEIVDRRISANKAALRDLQQSQ